MHDPEAVAALPEFTAALGSEKLDESTGVLGYVGAGTGGIVSSTVQGRPSPWVVVLANIVPASLSRTPLVRRVSSHIRIRNGVLLLDVYEWYSTQWVYCMVLTTHRISRKHLRSLTSPYQTGG